MASLSAAVYAQQLSALLPPGRAWTRRASSVLQRVLAALARSLARLDGAAAALLDDALPATSFWLLGDWERSLGLPDDCSDLSQTISGRRAVVVGRLVSDVGGSPADIEAFAARWGVAARVREAASAADADGFGYDVANGRWRFVWWIDLPGTTTVREFDTLSDVLTPLRIVDRQYDSEMECRLGELVPAHTHMRIGVWSPA